MSKCIRQIRIFDALQVRGSEDTLKWFPVNENYCFTDIVYVDNMCNPCGAFTKYQKTLHFIVDIDGEEFYIPDTHAILDSEGLPEHFKSYDKYINYRNEQPADWKKEYLKVTGIDITKTERTQYANQKEVDDYVKRHGT